MGSLVRLQNVFPSSLFESLMLLLDDMWAPLWLRLERICLQCRGPWFNLWARRTSWRRAWQPTPVFLPGEVHGQRSLVGYSPHGYKESDRTERLTLSNIL